MTASPDKAALPLPDYDHVPIGTLLSRISALDAGGVQQLIAYEEAHGARLPVLEVLRHRVDALERGAEPSGSVQQAMPEVTTSQSGSPVGPQTAGPKINPPSHGDPTNPAQPR